MEGLGVHEGAPLPAERGGGLEGWLADLAPSPCPATGKRGFVGKTGDMGNTFVEMSGDFLLRMMLVLPLLYNR